MVGNMEKRGRVLPSQAFGFDEVLRHGAIELWGQFAYATDV